MRISGQLSTVAIVSVMVPLAHAADMGTAFTYQGSLENGSGPVTDTCNFRFGLWDASAAGTLMGLSPQTKTGVAVATGVFSIESLDFGPAGIDGTARWLEIEVRCTGDPDFILLSPRVSLNPAPHALALPGLYTQQNAMSPNIIGGFSGNTVTADVVAATIGGGGSVGLPNRVTDHYGTVGGGSNNQAGDNAPPLGTSGWYATVGGGEGNSAIAAHSTVGGGSQNTASGPFHSTVGGGQFNRASGPYSTIAGGNANQAGGDDSTVAGGFGNLAIGGDSTIGGGAGNIVTGAWATVPGGLVNHAGGAYSLAAGLGAKVRNAAESGAVDGDERTFVWSDGSAGVPGLDFFTSTGPNQFLILASGGVGINTNAPAHPLQVGTDATNGNGAHVTIGGVWTNGSNRHSKQHFEQIDKREILERVAALPVSRWQYKSESENVRHIGPMAQDFYAAFGTGADERYIGTIDADGVALAAIQGLHQLVQEKDCEISTLENEISNLKSQISNLKELEARLARLEARSGNRSAGGNQP